MQFALTLEYIELTLYEEGVNTFFDQDFKNAGYQAEDRWRFKEIISQEIEHIGELRRSLGMMGAVPTEPCQCEWSPERTWWLLIIVHRQFARSS